MKILICEHDPYRAKLIQHILGVYNYKLITLNEQGSFLREANSQKPAVIVMNSQFDKSGKLNLINRLRSNPATSQIPVICINPTNLNSGEQKRNELDELTAMVNEPLKIKNLRHYIDRWTTPRSLYIKH